MEVAIVAVLADRGRGRGDKSIDRNTVLGIRIRNRIRMFSGLPDPDPLVRGADLDPAPDPSFFS
jgi:hypothetical protein